MSEDNSVYLESLLVPKGTKTPGDIQALVDLVSQYMRIRGVENYSQIQVGPIPPGADSEGDLWLEVNGAWEPQALKVWDGSEWRILESQIPYGDSGSRPENPKEGEKFYDLDLKQELVYLSGMWRTSWGGPGQRIFVHAGSPGEAERLYPGWAIDEEASGAFLRAGSQETGSKAKGGNAWITLNQGQLAPHSHGNLEMEMSSGARDFGPMPRGYDGGSAGVTVTPYSRTDTVGKGDPINITPPYYTLWVLKRLEY